VFCLITNSTPSTCVLSDYELDAVHGGQNFTAGNGGAGGRGGNGGVAVAIGGTANANGGTGGAGGAGGAGGGFSFNGVTVIV